MEIVITGEKFRAQCYKYIRSIFSEMQDNGFILHCTHVITPTHMNSKPEIKIIVYTYYNRYSLYNIC